MKKYIMYLCFIILFLNVGFYAQLKSEGDPIPSITPADNSTQILGKINHTNNVEHYSNPALQKVDKSFEAFWFQDNPTENFGYRFIPPDPIGAAGKNLLIAVVNSMIEARTKGGELKWREGLWDFYAPLFTNSFVPSELPFDPKIIYDEYRDRFLVVALEQADAFFGDPANKSRILIAVSKNSNPKNAYDWYFQAIDAVQTITVNLPPVFTTNYWADYPGFELDEEAIYITANMFSFVAMLPPPYNFPAQLYGGSRLWIMDKELYNGTASSVNVYDPYATDGIATTTMPAQVHGNAGEDIGTYLIAYSGLTDGVDEYAQIVRVDNPLNTPSFVLQYINLGNIEGPAFPALPDAPQAGSTALIEVNDRRALDAVWRDNYLWFVTTILPNSGTETGQTTAYWVKLNTYDPDAIDLEDQGVIGGEDIATNTITFFPSVAVNRDGTAKFGFSASAPTIFAGAYVTGRTQADAAGTVRASEIVHEGEAPYLRTFGGSRNRWGDYSGISIDPTNDDFAWVFNEYAAEPGSPTAAPAGPEDGRWGTAWARCKFTGLSKPDVVAKTLPDVFALKQNYPNPFNPSTIINFDIPSVQKVNLNVYNSLGQLVKVIISDILEPGSYNYTWDGKDQTGAKVASGVYLYKLTAGDFVKTNKMIIMK